MKLPKAYYHWRRVALNWLVAIQSMIAYGWPQRGVTLVGVTGTDGKTTTTQLLATIVQQSGRSVGLISTVGASINGQVVPLPPHVSTPGPAQVYQLLDQMRRQGVKVVIIEATSHGLDQRRLAGLHFAVGIVTNVAAEHLDYHGTMARYAAAKARLVGLSKVAVLNMADQRVAAMAARAKKTIGFGTGQSLVRAEKVQLGATSQFELVAPSGRVSVNLPLPGHYNVQNALAAAAAAEQLGISLTDVKAGLEGFKGVAGRWQVVQEVPFWVVVDFAHTPQAFAEVLPLAKQLATGKLYHVFGSAGARDASKRQAMAELSGRYADVPVITTEDPRYDKVEDIQQQLIAGLNKAGNSHFQRIDDRRAAITWAIGQARPGDVVLLTGKGHETTMNVNGQELPWDEVAEAKQALSETVGS